MHSSDRHRRTTVRRCLTLGAAPQRLPLESLEEYLDLRERRAGCSAFNRKCYSPEPTSTAKKSIPSRMAQPITERPNTTVHENSSPDQFRCPDRARRRLGCPSRRGDRLEQCCAQRDSCGQNAATKGLSRSGDLAHHHL